MQLSCIYTTFFELSNTSIRNLKGLQALFCLLKKVYGIKNEKYKIKNKKFNRQSTLITNIFSRDYSVTIILFSLRIKVYAQKPKSSDRSIW